MYSRGLFWFRRDLRLSDNAALYAALKNCDTVNFVFVFDTNILDKLQDKDDKRLSYIWESVQELKAKLNKLGSHLYILHGDPIELIPRLASELNVNCVFANRDYEAYALHRDDSVQAHLNKKEIHFASNKDQLIFEALEVTKPDKNAYTIFTPYKKTWLNKLNTDLNFYLQAYPSKKYLSKDKLEASPRAHKLKEINSLSEMGFVKADNLVLPIGEDKANQEFDNFVKNGLATYKQNRNFVKLKSTSDLSVHLRFGTISIRKCFGVVYQLMQQNQDPDFKENAEIWLSELIWREFYSMILQAFPHVEENAFKAEYRNLMWRVDEKLLQAWQEGMTGYPIVDAAMRQLKTTGQMSNRARMIVASFLTKDLLIDWRKGEAHFARYLLDFDLASNNGGWQWASSTGTDAAPYFRIFNPCLQSEKSDPQAEYIKQFIPELSSIPAAKIHKLDFEVKNYPKPIVRHDEAKQAVLSLFKSAQAKSRNDE